MALERAAAAGMGLSLEMMQRARTEGEDSIILALNYRCNSRCRFCIIETEIRRGLEETDPAVFEELFAFNGRHRRWRRLILSGAEATLHPGLEELARRATGRGGFEVVRIQTNARRLGDAAYARALAAAGVREYFVSIHAHSAALDARITRSRRSFGELHAGLAVLRGLGVRLISSTVVSADNAAHLPAIARFLLREGLRESQLWSVLEIGDVGQADQLVPLAESLPPLLEALEILDAAGSALTLKWFPRCLLGRFADRLDNHQPQLLIRDAFQARLSDGFVFGCAHRDCRWLGRGCGGLHRRYTERFGDERALLVPS